MVNMSAGLQDIVRAMPSQGHIPGPRPPRYAQQFDIGSPSPQSMSESQVPLTRAYRNLQATSLPTVVPLGKQMGGYKSNAPQYRFYEARSPLAPNGDPEH